MKTGTLMVAAGALAAVMALAPAGARAATFTLDDAVVVVQGGTAGLAGTVAREDFDPDPLFLDGLDITVDGLSTDDGPFLIDWPLSISASFGPALMFNLTADPGLAPGVYSGSARVIASDGEGTSVEIQAQDFRVTVREGQVIPEPVTLALLGLGLLGVSTRRRA